MTSFLDSFFSHNKSRQDVQNSGAGFGAFSTAVRSLFRGGAQAEAIPTVYACVRVISDSISVLPLSIHKGDKEGVSEREPRHPVHRLLSVKPNPWQTPADFKKYQQRNLLLRGNAYARKVYDGPRLSALYPLNPDLVKPFWYDEGKHAYKVMNPKGGYEILLPEEIMHLRGPGDGLEGDSPLDVLRRTIEHNETMTEHAYKTFQNGGSVKSAFTVPEELSDEAYKRLKKDLNEQYSGAENAGKMVLLEGGAKLEALNLSLMDLQFIEAYKLSRSEIASAFGVPMHKINDLDKATFSNIEHQSLEFYTDTLLPWIVVWEETIDRDLILYPETYFAGFDADRLLRADVKSRAGYYKEMVMMGAMTRNEVRHRENLKPLEGLDTPILPLNLATVEERKDAQDAEDA